MKRKRGIALVLSALLVGSQPAICTDEQDHAGTSTATQEQPATETPEAPTELPATETSEGVPEQPAVQAPEAPTEQPATETLEAIPERSDGMAFGLTTEQQQALYEEIMQEVNGTLTQEEIDKRLEAIRQRAALTRNTTLQEYAEYMAQAYELQAQLAQINGLVKGLTANDPTLAALDKKLRDSVECTVTLEEVFDILPTVATDLLRQAGLDTVSEFSDCWMEILDKLATELQSDSATTDGEEETLAEISAETRHEIALKLLIFAENHDLITGEQVLKDLESQIIQENDSYHAQTLQKLKTESDGFLTCAKFAGSVTANHFIVKDRSVVLQVAPIVYQGQILIAIEDFAQLFQGKVTEYQASETVAMLAGTLLIEMQKGSSVVYITDKPFIASVPVLVYDKHTYVSAEVVAQAMGVSYIKDTHHAFFMILDQ